MTTNKILVLGGTGFIGREICRRAAKAGFKVTSLSRNPRIPYTHLTAVDVRDWESKVNWRYGDATQRDILETLLTEHDAVIHSIGLLFEYNFNSLFSGSRSDGSGLSYEHVNMETALMPLAVLESLPNQGQPKPFVFISAANHPPFLKRYLTTKRLVEQRLLDAGKKNIIRPVIFRPGVVYHHSKWTSLTISRLATYGNALDKTVKDKFGISLGLPDPTPLDLIATAAVRAISRPEVHGIITNKEMWELTSSEKPEI